MPTHCSYPGCSNSYYMMKRSISPKFTMHEIPKNQRLIVARLIGLNIAHFKRFALCSVHLRDDSYAHKQNMKRFLRRDIPFYQLLKPSCTITHQPRISIKSFFDSVPTSSASQTRNQTSFDEMDQLRKQVESANAKIKQLEWSLEQAKSESRGFKTEFDSEIDRNDSMDHELVSQIATYEREIQQINDERIDLETANLVLQSKIDSNQARINELDLQFEKARKALVVAKSKIKHKEELKEETESEESTIDLAESDRETEIPNLVSLKFLNERYGIESKFLDLESLGDFKNKTLGLRSPNDAD